MIRVYKLRSNTDRVSREWRLTAFHRTRTRWHQTSGWQVKKNKQKRGVYPNKQKRGVYPKNPLESLCSIASGTLRVYPASREEWTRPQKTNLLGMVKHTDTTSGLGSPWAEHQYGLGAVEGNDYRTFALLLPSCLHGQDPGTPSACGVPGLFPCSAKPSDPTDGTWRSRSTAKHSWGHQQHGQRLKAPTDSTKSIHTWAASASYHLTSSVRLTRCCRAALRLQPGFAQTLSGADVSHDAVSGCLHFRLRIQGKK